MDFQQRKKQAIKSEFTRLNKWDDESELTVKQQRVETAERMVRQKEQQNSAFRKELANYYLEMIKREIFVQEMLLGLQTKMSMVY